MLDVTDTQVVVLANFHVAVNVEQWESELGQRVALQCGAFVWKTEFEHDKLKGKLDVGSSYLRVLSDKEGRITITETAFFGGGERKELSNEELLQSFMEDLGI